MALMHSSWRRKEEDKRLIKPYQKRTSKGGREGRCRVSGGKTLVPTKEFTESTYLASTTCLGKVDCPCKNNNTYIMIVLKCTVDRK